MSTVVMFLNAKFLPYLLGMAKWKLHLNINLTKNNILLKLNTFGNSDASFKSLKLQSPAWGYYWVVAFLLTY
jgi:predicted nuclease of restriction endonuclease-like RecB superfamily